MSGIESYRSLNMPGMLFRHAGPGRALSRLDLAAFPEAERFDLWHALGLPSYRTTASPEARDAIRVRSWAWSASPLILTGFEASAFTTIRGAAELGREPGDVLKVKLYSRGRTWFVAEGAVTPLGVGAVHIIDQSRPKTEISTEREHLALFVPHAAVGFDPGRHPPLVSLGVEAGTGAMMAAAMMALAVAVLGMPGGSHRDRADEVLALLRGVLAERADEDRQRSLGDVRRRAMRRHVRRTAGQEQITAETLEGMFGASRASVYRAFEEVGGLRTFALACRLDRAFETLAGAAPRRGIVGEIALALGFASTGAFVRSFRSRHGVRPGDIVGSARLRPADDGPVDALAAGASWGAFGDIYARFDAGGAAGARGAEGCDILSSF